MLGFLDNNRIHVKTENGIIEDWIAECCEIIEKVEEQ
jgi:hypothetical protein